MLAQQRHHKILELLEKNGFVSIDEIIELCTVTRMTVWRDFKKLEDNKKLTKVHGGATKYHEPKSLLEDPQAEKIITTETPFEEKMVRETLRKQLIARYCAMELVHDGDMLFLDSGTTVLEMLPHLKQEKLTLMSNGLQTIITASQYIPHFTVKCVGGILRESVLEFIGREAEKSILENIGGSFFFSASAVHEELGIMDPNSQSAKIKQTMWKQAKRRYLLADSSKINKQSKAKIGDIADVDLLITDNGADPNFCARIEALGVPVKLISMEWFRTLYKSEFRH